MEYKKTRFEYDTLISGNDYTDPGSRYFVYDLVLHKKPGVILCLTGKPDTSFFTLIQAVKDYNLKSVIYIFIIYESGHTQDCLKDNYRAEIENVRYKLYSQININIREINSDSLFNELKKLNDNPVDFLIMDGGICDQYSSRHITNILTKIAEDSVVMVKEIKRENEIESLKKRLNKPKNTIETLSFVNSDSLNLICMDADDYEEFIYNGFSRYQLYSLLSEKDKLSLLLTKKEKELSEIQKKYERARLNYRELLIKKNGDFSFLNLLLGIVEDSKRGMELLRSSGLWEFCWRFYWYLRGKKHIQDIPHSSEILLSGYKGGNSPDYHEWIENNDTLSDTDRQLIRNHIYSFREKPLFSVIMPVYNPRPELLSEALESVLDQVYPKWELCIADDASTEVGVRELLSQYSEIDERIKVTFRQSNGGISICSNTAIGMSAGDWIVLMDHDDTISEHALYLAAEKINRFPNTGIIYSDEDRIDNLGRRFNPYFKPEWDYDLFLGQNLISHLGIYRKDYVENIGGFREGVEGSQDWDFALRIIASNPDVEIRHVPFILYHWRDLSESFSKKSLNQAVESAVKAVNDHLKHMQVQAYAEPVGFSSHLKIRRELQNSKPFVSVVIPFAQPAENLKKCIESIYRHNLYSHFEIILCGLITQKSKLERFRNKYSDINIKTSYYEGELNICGLINNGVKNSDGEILILLQCNCEVITPEWIEKLSVHAVRPEVGAVGAKVYNEKGYIEHGGMVTGAGEIGICDLSFKQCRNLNSTYFNHLFLERNVTAVSAHCIATRKELFNKYDGFDESNLSLSFYDLDYCLKIREAGLNVIWTPHVELNIWNATDENKKDEKKFYSDCTYIHGKWHYKLKQDPYYNPNLSLKPELYKPAHITRVSKPWKRYNYEYFPSANMSSTCVLNSATVCLITRNEGKYLLEWMAYYLSLGFNRILIYDNESTDNTKDIVCTAGKNDQRISYFYWTNRNRLNPQIEAYNDSLRRVETEWITFLDADEFLVLKDHESVQEYLGEFDTTAGAVCINWLIFGSSGHDRYTDDLVIRRFNMCTNPKFSENEHVKSIVRTNAAKNMHVHAPELYYGFYKGEDGNNIRLEDYGRNLNISHRKAQINHYVIKSKEEFLWKKNRGCATLPANSAKKYFKFDADYWDRYDRNEFRDTSAHKYISSTLEIMKQLKQKNVRVPD